MAHARWPMRVQPLCAERGWLTSFESAPTYMQGVLEEPFFQGQGRLDATTLDVPLISAQFP